jgi:hypothetical protein
VTRDEILRAIKDVSTVPAGQTVTLSGVANMMAEVERLSDLYMEEEGYDRVYLLEAVLSAQARTRRALVNVIGD